MEKSPSWKVNQLVKKFPTTHETRKFTNPQKPITGPYPKPDELIGAKGLRYCFTIYLVGLRKILVKIACAQTEV